MSILDRYIARQYLINVVALTLILFSFVVVIDASLNFERFMDHAQDMLADAEGEAAAGVRTWLVTLLLIADFWWPKLLQLFNFLIGMILIGAMGFTFAQMTRHREFVALMAAGVGLGRAMRPVLVIAAAFMVLQGLNTELLIPRIAPLLVRDHGDVGTHELGAASVPLTPDGSGRLFRAASFDADTDTLEGVYILERDEQGKARRAITAESAQYRAGGWDLSGGTVQNRGDGALRPPEPIDRIESTLGPDELRLNRYESYAQALSFSQVSQMLDRETLVDPDKRARYARLKWGRFSMMLSSLLALLIAMPFFLTREPRNMVVQSIKAAPVAILAIVGGVLGASAPIPGLPAVVSVFIPVMILSVVAVAQVCALRT